MNLPNINLGPLHTVYLNVMKKEIHFVPFTVAQEKSLLSASTENNSKDIINNYLFVAKACVQEELDWENITLIDFMKLAILLRAKSQGETLELQKKECEICKKSYPFKVNIEEAITFENENELKKIVEIDESLKIEVIPLKIDYLQNFEDFKNEIDIYISMISHSISKIFFKENIYTNLTAEDIQTNCVNNLTKQQLKLIIKEIENLISMKLVLNIKCPHCQNEERIEVKNFLEL